ncbi:MAG: hypothetical protein DME03_04790 [Candidatus Rokuibacteriota bacterium]|nr:MAG: hypothetical protein DME03_04790 [Candidatus Rokubacteria bacterium]
MPKTTQLVLTLKSKPGVLAGISSALAAARVNILSLAAAEAAGRGKIRMIVNNPAAAKRTLRKARIRFVEEPAFAKRLRNKPGALARVVEKLARARVNLPPSPPAPLGGGARTGLWTGDSAQPSGIYAPTRIGRWRGRRWGGRGSKGPVPGERRRASSARVEPSRKG